MSGKKAAAQAAKIADDYTSAEIDDHLESTLALIGSADKEWPGLVKLPAADKSGNLGKLVARLSGPLTTLFGAITPADGDDPQKRAAKARFAAVFDSMLGAQDHGKDPARFEPELLLLRLRRIEAQLQIAAALEAARERFADDAMNTGEMVIEPGLRALDIARTAAASNPELRSLVAPVLDQLGDLTRKARKYQEEARKAAEAAKAAKPPAEPPAKAAANDPAKT